MADQFGGIDAFGLPNAAMNSQYSQDTNESVPTTNLPPKHKYSDTVADLDLTSLRKRRYSALNFQTDYSNAYFDANELQLNQEDSKELKYAQYAARNKVAQVAMMGRRHENILKQQQQAIAEENKRMEHNIYQKVERPKNRKEWVKGTHVLVQKDGSSQWFHGTIVSIFVNPMGEEILNVLYYEFDGNTKYKSVRRYENNVKAPNEDAWELFKKEENENMHLVKKLFTGIKGDENEFRYEEEKNMGLETAENDLNGMNAIDEVKEEGENENDKDENESGDEEGSEDGKKKKKKKKKDKKKKKKKKRKKGDDSDEDGDDDGKKKGKKKKDKKSKKDKKKDDKKKRKKDKKSKKDKKEKKSKSK